MYRDSNSLGCLDATACRVGNGIITQANKIGDNILASAKRIGTHINADILRIGDGLIVKSNKIGKGLIVSCNTIHSVNKDATLSVSTNVVELTYNGEPVLFNITSNTSWIIS